MNIVNRILLVQMLPSQGTFDNLIVSRSIRKKVELTVDELEKFSIKVDEGNLSMSREGALYTKEMNFSPREHKLILELLEIEKEKEELYITFLDFYEYFQTLEIPQPECQKTTDNSCQ